MKNETKQRYTLGTDDAVSSEELKRYCVFDRVLDEAVTPNDTKVRTERRLRELNNEK